MDEKTIGHVERLFYEAIKLRSEEERNQFILSSCKRDPSLAQYLSELLKAHQEAGTFLSPPQLHRPFQEETTCFKEDLAAGTRLGRYTLHKKIGEGGMGIVYLAEQAEPVRRQVAVKIIKKGMDTRAIIARFESERQALAMMEHPSIAKIFDGGETETGRPYFVMELVNGQPITKVCAQEKMPLAARLRLFILVCRAVQHAHQKGIIHRDLKPSNVLVAVEGGVQVPKIIDFGVAKLLASNTTDETAYTMLGQIIGTPAYMSPEQTRLQSREIDTRSDVYSLGVLLYEILVGATPFDSNALLNLSFEEMYRQIREVEPLRPSSRIKEMAPEEVGKVAENLRVPAAKVRTSFEGDLDCIVARALEKERAQRYDSPNALADAPIPALPRYYKKEYKLSRQVRRL